MSSELLEIVFERAGVALCLVTPDWTVVGANAEWRRWTGYSAEQLIGADLHTLLPELRSLALYGRVQAGDQVAIPLHSEQVRGRMTWWQGQLAPVPMEHGIGILVTAREVPVELLPLYSSDSPSGQRSDKAIGLWGTTADDTDRQRVEQAARRSPGPRSALGQTVDYGAWVCQSDGHNVYVSEAFLALLGLTQPQYAGLGWTNFLHPDDAESTLAAWQECVRSGGSWERELRFRGADGEWHHILSRGLPVKDEQGAVAYFTGTNLDITSLQHAQKALSHKEDLRREAERQKSDFLALLAHELRNPLAPIRNGLYILDRVPAGTSQFDRAKQLVKRQVDNLARLADDLRDITRITREPGMLTLTRNAVDARDVVSRACDEVRVMFDERDIELLSSLPREPVWIFADIGRVAQVVTNLLHNAAKFTPSGGLVQVELRSQLGQCEVRVQDSGGGIDPELLPRIFEPFAKPERTRDSSKGGLGLGLALVKHLVELHEGTVQAFSAGIGRGAEFVIALPVAAPPPARGPAGQKQAAPLTILIVEDNRYIGESLAELLQLQGHKTQVVRSGRLGVTTARQLVPEVLICDLGLPDLSGYDVIRELRSGREAANIFAIALTGNAHPGDERRALAAGFDGYLAKPPMEGELGQLLAQVQAKRPKST